jgi:two-component system cell cycle sensor histidine kinase/response regulator CckA
MPRKLLILALVIVALHICEALTLGTSTAGTFLANGLQLLACGLAAAMTFGAHRRARGLSRPFWLLISFGIAMWGLANLGWMYYEIVLHSEPPTGSAVRFLFGLQVVFFAMALFLDQDKDSRALDAESVLDFVQIAIVFFFIFIGFYYLPAHHFSEHDAVMREIRVETGEYVVLVGLAVVQAARARTQHLRRLYGGLALYLFSYSAGQALADYVQSIRQLPTGTSLDLAYTLPFLGAALWAACWQPVLPSDNLLRLRRKTIGGMLLTNATLALAPLIVLLQVSQLESEWRVVRFSLLGVSIVCFAARLGISAHREAKSAETVRRQTLAMESAVDGMAILNAQGEFTYLNSAHAHVFGYEDPSELIGKTWRALYDSAEVAVFESTVLPQLFAKSVWRGESRAKRRDGSFFPQELSLTLLENGGFVCICRDVNERRSAEKARAEVEAKYRALIEQVAAISYIAEIGLNAEWHYVSPQIGSIIGYSSEEWLGSSREWMRHVHPEDHAIVESAEAASIKGEPFQAEYRMLRKDGRVIWVSDTAVVVRDSQGHALMEGFIVDITERKQLEVQLQQSRRMEAVGRLAGGIAHDFNNLLTIIKGYTELALNRPGIQSELRSDIERIEDASERAATLVRQLLAFGRKQVLQPKNLDLNSIVLGLDKLLRRLMGEHIEMRTMVGEDVGTVKADPGQIEQVIMNLVVNARDAMPNGGRLTVETANVDLDSTYARDHATVRPGRYVMLAVTDTGVGMDAETAAHIFEPFYTTKGGASGTGLGLATVYGIVKQSGGYIWVYSEPGKGSSFKVYLPRVDESAEAPLPTKKHARARKGTETILLVEDEPAVRELTRMVLAAQGYSVVEALSPEDAERISENSGTEIHLLLTDVVMPGVSGRELAKRITARHPKMRVLYMSGYTHNVIASGGMLESGIAFLQKPFTPAVLVQRVRDVLDARGLMKS